MVCDHVLFPRRQINIFDGAYNGRDFAYDYRMIVVMVVISEGTYILTYGPNYGGFLTYSFYFARAEASGRHIQESSSLHAPCPEHETLRYDLISKPPDPRVKSNLRTGNVCP
jgi:hypothetical protein